MADQATNNKNLPSHRKVTEEDHKKRQWSVSQNLWGGWISTNRADVGISLHGRCNCYHFDIWISEVLIMLTCDLLPRSCDLLVPDGIALAAVRNPDTDIQLEMMGDTIEQWQVSSSVSHPCVALVANTDVGGISSESRAAYHSLTA